VIEVERIAGVPLAPPEVVGIFSLRGAPVPIVDLTSSLGAGAPRGTARIALVLRMDAMVVALAIDRMDGVLPVGRGKVTAANDDGESPLVAGFVEVPERSEVVTVISPAALLAHLDKLRFARAEG
jgi:purine-binding chemotaxis protein CheW